MRRNAIAKDEQTLITSESLEFKLNLSEVISLISSNDDAMEGGDDNRWRADRRIVARARKSDSLR